MRVFVISLQEAEERREIMRARLSAAGLAFEFFDAVDGRGFDVPLHPAYDAWRRRSYFGKDLSGGELGCLLSHRAVYEKMVTEGIKAALILEDVAILDADFTAVLQGAQGCEYDIIRFMDKPKLSNVPSRVVRDLGSGYSLRQFCAIPGGAYAYVITLEGARKMIAELQRNYRPVDTVMGHVWMQGLKSYIVWPRVASWDAAQGSYIGQARFDKSASGLRPWYYPATRLYFKVYEGVMKRVWYTFRA